MLTFLFTIALAAAAPAQQAAPANPHAGHGQSGHSVPGGSQHSGHDLACCKDKAGSADCCKGKDADCCASHAKASAGNSQHSQ